MSEPLRVLHITPHLGCGVGRVLSQVAQYHVRERTGIHETFISLESPEKRQFVDAITNVGVPVLFDVSREATEKLIAEADIVQLEWWHHPRMAQWLHDMSGMQCRLAVWAHTSGLHYPAFPRDFAELPHTFMATTAASPAGVTVPSSGGFEDIPERIEFSTGKPRYGYLGSLGPAKLHPEIMAYIDAAGPDFRLSVYGDDEAGTPLKAHPNITRLGYTNAPADALAGMDVFIYLLNPMHYGTTENALLEAMAAGVVPIVMNNKVEATIARHGETGMVVSSPTEFSAALKFLETNPEQRVRMAKAAAQDIRARFSLAATAKNLIDQYQKIRGEEPCLLDFDGVLGETPFAWFMAGLGRYAPLFAEGAETSQRASRRSLPFLYEKNKSSVFHYARYFPQDEKLAHWARVLETDHAAA